MLNKKKRRKKRSQAPEIETSTITLQHHKKMFWLKPTLPKTTTKVAAEAGKKHKINKTPNDQNFKTKRILWFWFYGLSIRNALSYYFGLLIIRIMFL